MLRTPLILYVGILYVLFSPPPTGGLDSVGGRRQSGLHSQVCHVPLQERWLGVRQLREASSELSDVVAKCCMICNTIAACNTAPLCLV